MSPWLEVRTYDELEAFLRVVGGFHDGVLKEVHWVNRDHVSASLAMVPYRLADARVLGQRQWANPSAVEIYFEGVWRLSLDTVDFIFGTTAGTAESSAQIGPPRPLLTLDLESSHIAFERMFWRDASGWIDAEPRFGPFEPPTVPG
ncbi:MAG: hypothetical protein KIS66_05455 [Fimbriimonadaceae bacterium]|nr:hypothetical protein [Fimbriimonadaceae bacterium]